MYHTVAELLELADTQKVPLWVPVLQNECKMSGLSEEEIFKQLDERYEVMYQSATRALTESRPTVGGLIEGVARTHHQYAQTNGGIMGKCLNMAMSRALSCSETNAAMGRICAAPTAGACGIMPAVLISVAETYDLPRRVVLEGLLTASGIGAIITKNATVSGAEGGCQAECGVAASMAAAAAVQMAGGSPQMAAHAVSLALMNCLGLVCDPVAGLVQVPCAQRNASQAINAILSADLALGGMQSIIPTDEVIEAMYRVGKQLPMQLRETALGGIAASPTGRAIYEKIFK